MRGRPRQFRLQAASEGAEPGADPAAREGVLRRSHGGRAVQEPCPFGEPRRQAVGVASVEPVERGTLPLLETDRGENVEQAVSALPLRPCLAGNSLSEAPLGVRFAEGETRHPNPAADFLVIVRRTGERDTHAASIPEMS